MSRDVGFNALDIFAVIEDAAGGGYPTDPNAPRNAPAIDPVAHLDKVYFHSDLFYYDLVQPAQTVVVNHPSVGTDTTIVGNEGYGTPASGPNGIYITVHGRFEVNTHTLVTHNLGYVPRYFISYAGTMLTNGRIVQNPGSIRYVAGFATDTIIGLREVAVTGSSGLAAINRSYTVYIFNTPSADPGQPLMYNEADADVIMGRGKVRSDRSVLREVAAGESSVDIDLGPTIDNNDGGIRVVTGGNVIDDVNYTGSFSGPPFVPVGY